MQVRVRMSAGLARLADAPAVTLDLDEGATVDDALARLGVVAPAVAGALGAALPVVAGEHAERSRALHHGDEVALLLPVSGG
jgi:molybdopterin converting factor small subunit